jgi:uncharacterized protein
MDTSRTASIDTFVLKIASRCNLNCSYCYVYNKEDKSWVDRPKILSDDILAQTIHRIREHIIASGQRRVAISFHGGEPLLVGKTRFTSYCNDLLDALSPHTEVTLSLQTNGVLVDAGWVEIFRRFKIAVGLSIDGPESVHDLVRPDRRGLGTYHRVAAAADLMIASDLEVSALVVIQPGTDGLAVHQCITDLGFAQVNYLLPDLSPGEHSSITASYGATPCADFLLPILNSWSTQTHPVRVLIFEQIAKLILGGSSMLDTLGNGPLRFLFIETDGDIESLDVLKVCYNDAAGMAKNVRTNAFAEVAEGGQLFSDIFNGRIPLPQSCAGCPEANTCAGGYLPHRYDADGSFDHSSYWCRDIKSLFAAMRDLLEVSPQETALRKSLLRSVQPLDVVYVPSPDPVVSEMLDLADINPGDRVYDLGCGDGRLLVEAARQGAICAGIDLDPQRVKDARQAVTESGMIKSATIYEGDLFDLDFSDADVIFLYLHEGLNRRLKPRLLQLSKGARVISHGFAMPDWTPETSRRVGSSTIFRWRITEGAQAS